MSQDNNSNTPVDCALAEHTVERETVFDGNLLRVWRDRVRLPNGGTAQREYICHPGAVVVVAQCPNGELLLERQFRYPVRQTFIEFPAGKIDAGEPILDCAQRELREETGFRAEHWQHLGRIHPCIGYSDERIEVFLARGLSAGQAERDDEEFLEVFQWPVSRLEAAIRKGEVSDAKTIAALYLAAPHLQAPPPNP